ncbi:putative cysteine-rich repeat secretory protein 6 [Silene latifolia]|uniref:putative cysteine-rich repeat secretory protein 6 n=1 Tax=Silene latifolia TaxID=37657 RepID=UPI003D776C1E
MALCCKIISFIIIISTLNNLAISLLDREFGSFSICMEDLLTKGNSSYQNYYMSVSSLLSNLARESSQPPIPAFFSTTTGSSRDKAYGSYMCWGNITPQLCQQCVHYVTKENLNIGFISTDCYAYGTYMFSNICLIRYSNQSVNEYKKGGSVFPGGIIGGKVADYTLYNKTLSTTVEGLIREAGYGNWTRTNFATRVVPVSGSRDKIHVLVQCTPVISAKNCSQCLQEVYDSVPKSFRSPGEFKHRFHPIGGEVINGNCILKFSNQTLIGGA